jgi:hypothetical protein
MQPHLLQLANEHAALFIEPLGTVISLRERERGREWQDRACRVPLFAAERAGVTFPPTEIAVAGSMVRLVFAQFGFSCHLACRTAADHFLFRVESVDGPRPEMLCFFGLRVAPEPVHGTLHHGRQLNTVWDDRFSVTLLALHRDTEARSLPDHVLQARAHDRFGLVGAQCALLTVPTAQLDRALVNIAGRYGLPQPTLDGQPAKLSPVVRRGNLIAAIDAADADQALAWAKRGNLRHVVIDAGTWHDRYGHYRIHPGKFPGGVDAFRAFVERFHATGIGMGIHLGSSNIGWEDPYMTPVPDRRLTTAGRFRLASAVGASDRWLQTDAHPLVLNRRVVFDYRDFGPQTAAFGAGHDHLETVSIAMDDTPCVARLDDELIRLRHNLQGMGFEALERGIYGTAPSAHAAGAEIVILRQLYGAFLLDLYSTLLDEVAASVADIYNACGLDMIYFDCLEGMAGPPWHARARLHEAFLRRLDRECLAQGSDYPHFSWHWFARYGTSDCVPSNASDHVAHTRIPRARDCRDNRMPADMGWFQLYAERENRAATTPAEVAYLCERAGEWHASIAIQSTMHDLKNNPDTGRILDIVAAHEQRMQ